ncbi:MAG: substrate-binding domain-containing protein [Clostridia bacterium]|nr:substrate-binding domain-containing protein [Clostridia bacterium]
MISKKNLAVLSMLLVLLLVIAGCGADSSAPQDSVTEGGDQESSDQESSDKDSGDSIVIGALLMDTQQEWFAEVMEGMKSAADDLGVEVKVMSSDSDAAKEADIVDNFISQQVDAISICPTNQEASIPALDRIDAAGIPVVQWNTKVESDKFEYYVGVDNYSLGAQTGEFAAKYIEENMDGKAKIAVLGISKYAIGIDRVKGFLDEMEKLEGVEIVDQQDAEFKEDGMSVTESMLQANPDTDIIWAWNQGALLGGLAALKGSNSDIPIMGTDMSIDIAKAMLEEDSQLLAVTTQQPFEIGYKSIETAVKLVKGEDAEENIIVPLVTYTLENKDEIQKYLDDREYLMK